MIYSIQEHPAFSVIGQDTGMTKYQRENIQISKQFWKQFNANLKKVYLAQSGNWTKYAFMEKRDGILRYYCAIPKKAVIPESFILKEVKSHRYLVVQHIGPIDKIYDTYKIAYQEILPNNSYVPLQEDFLHFEKYDFRFHWNREDSIIEIWIPIQI